MSEAVDRRLFLVRHASAEPVGEASSDRQRMLRPKGAQESVELGFEMADRGYVPQLVLGSSATRTWQTWQHMIGAFPRAVDARFTDFLYSASDEDILGLLRRLPESVERVMVVGHNPALERLADRLSGERTTLNPGDMIALQLETEWAEIADRSTQVLGVIRH